MPSTRLGQGQGQGQARVRLGLRHAFHRVGFSRENSRFTCSVCGGCGVVAAQP